MVNRTKKSASRRKTKGESEILESITGSDALSILSVIAQRDEKIKTTIEKTALEILSAVDVDEIAAEVQVELEVLQVEGVCARAGANREGYVEPGDVAWQMFEEALSPFGDNVEKYKKLSMPKKGTLYCLGIWKGIYAFDKDSKTQYKEWAVDASGEYFAFILEDWTRLYKGKIPMVSIKDFLERNCPDWIEWSVKLLRSSGR